MAWGLHPCNRDANSIAPRLGLGLARCKRGAIQRPATLRCNNCRHCAAFCVTGDGFCFARPVPGRSAKLLDAEFVTVTKIAVTRAAFCVTGDDFRIARPMPPQRKVARCRLAWILTHAIDMPTGDWHGFCPLQGPCHRSAKLHVRDRHGPCLASPVPTVPCNPRAIQQQATLPCDPADYMPTHGEAGRAATP